MSRLSWLQNDLLHRALRFTVTVILPVAIGLYRGIEPWLVFATLGAIVSFVGDEGGKPVERLCLMAIGPLAMLIGAGIGTSIAGNFELLLPIAILAGILYGLVETTHPHLLLATRFFGYGLVLSGAVAPVTGQDAGAILAALLDAWIISILWDLVRSGRLRPRLAAPLGPVIRAILHGQAGKWSFALATGMVVGSAFVVCIWLGIGHPYWTTLTILVVLRSEMEGSVALINHRISGTLLGVFVAGLIITFLPERTAILICLVIAAGLRWPAYQIGTAFGVGCLTAFALLLGELLAPTPEAAIHNLQERLLATFIGCCFALLALTIDQQLKRLGTRGGIGGS